jgi:hypothetical protein
MDNSVRKDRNQAGGLNVGNWPRAGTRIAEIGAALLTFKGLPQRPVWSEQFRKSTVA